MQTINTFNFPAVLTATLSCFLVGAIWYSPIFFGSAWSKECGFTDESLKLMGGRARIMCASFALQFIMAVNLEAFIGPKESWRFGAFAGAAAGVGWVALAFGTTYLFERRSLKLYLINAGYHSLAFAIMGTILGAWH